MSVVHKSVLVMWEDYLKSIGEDIENTEKTYDSWHFELNEKDANELVELVLSGKKRGTASSTWIFEYDNEPIPKQGDLSIVTNWDGIAQCIIRTKTIEIVPFKDVTEEFAKVEGEGDSSLRYWREGHRNFFKEECLRIGKKFTEELPVVCEEFEVVFKLK